MVPLLYLLITFVVTSAGGNPSTESTHVVLEKLGFEKINKQITNHHRKRLAGNEINKARYKIDDYNSDTDSHMFLVKLPPHPPYYTQQTADSQKEIKPVTKPPIHFRTNGKPSKVYHWNIPVLRKIVENKYRSNHKTSDSQVYNVKIHHGEKNHYVYKTANEIVKPQKHKKRNDVSVKTIHEENQKHLRNVLNDMAQDEPKRKEHVMTIKELAENGYQHIKHDKHPNEVVDTEITNIFKNKHNWNKKKSHSKLPSVYLPSIPKQNSFYKYFPGNGKPKTFYVIEKSKNASRYHRLL